MIYKKTEHNKDGIIDDSVVTETINIIKELTNEDFDVAIENEVELINFIDYPEQYLNDVNLINKIKELKEVIINLGEFYYA